MTTNTGMTVEVLLAWQVDAPRDASREPERSRSVSDEVYKCHREGSSPHRVTFNVAQLWRGKTEWRGQRMVKGSCDWNTKSSDCFHQEHVHNTKTHLNTRAGFKKTKQHKDLSLFKDSIWILLSQLISWFDLIQIQHWFIGLFGISMRYFS